MEDDDMSTKAYLEITMSMDEANHPAAAKVYADYRQPFLAQINKRCRF